MGPLNVCLIGQHKLRVGAILHECVSPFQRECDRYGVFVHEGH